MPPFLLLSKPPHPTSPEQPDSCWPHVKQILNHMPACLPAGKCQIYTMKTIPTSIKASFCKSPDWALLSSAALGLALAYGLGGECQVWAGRAAVTRALSCSWPNVPLHPSDQINSPCTQGRHLPPPPSPLQFSSVLESRQGI